ncbi:MAG: M4 family metallopeptidase [Lachnospiraceae bacterium]|nr:M4 family metallopeptidase [Lachnospiraceae bacterium]
MGYFNKKRFRQKTALLFGLLFLMSSLCACNLPYPLTEERFGLDMDGGLAGRLQGITGDAQGISAKKDPIERKDDGSYVLSKEASEGQLTPADIQEMNDGNAVLIYNENGYLSTLVGRFYDKRIKVVPGDIETFNAAISALQGMASLLGLTRGCAFITAYGSQDREGYTYLTYRQRYGGTTVDNATLHIVLDPEGYPCALSQNFSPEAGTKQAEEISEEEALAIVKKQYRNYDLTYYPEATRHIVLSTGSHVENCYVVYCSNPFPVTDFENLQYMAVYVSFDGSLIGMLPTSNLEVSSEDAYNSADFFEGMEPARFEGKVTMPNGDVLDLSLPTAYHPADGKYYLMDPGRRVAVAEYADFNNAGELAFLTSKSNQDWRDKDLITYWNYLRAYEFYAGIDIKGPDGFETPVLILRNMVNDAGEPIDNACFIDLLNGWYTFGYSEINDYSTNLDCVIHEYTHAVSQATLQGSQYWNDYGAINEAFCDIMGNIGEMKFQATTDDSWLMLEMSGETMRSMSEPHDYGQPVSVGDIYYVPNAGTPTMLNDAGGVHTNSSLLSHTAYELQKAGMSLDEQIDLWFTSLQLLTPGSSFEDVYGALVYSARSNGLEKYEPLIWAVFKTAGLYGTERQFEERYLTQEGCGRFYMEMDEDIANSGRFAVYIYGEDDQLFTVTWPDQEGVLTGLLPVGGYYFQIRGVNAEGKKLLIHYVNDGWVIDEDGVYDYDLVRITERETTELNGFE